MGRDVLYCSAVDGGDGGGLSGSEGWVGGGTFLHAHSRNKQNKSPVSLTPR